MILIVILGLIGIAGRAEISAIDHDFGMFTDIFFAIITLDFI